jgi:energy-coupling factor transporter ATP-binding protein EcfA2
LEFTLKIDPELLRTQQLRQRQDAVLQLATQIVTVGCRLFLGPAGQIVGTLGDLLLKDRLNRLEQRKVDRMLQACIDIISERTLLFLETELSNLPDNERSAAIIAVSDTFERSGITQITFTDLDLDARLVWSYLQPISQVVLKDALLSEAALELYRLILKESCEYLVQFVWTLPQFESNALLTLLRRETIILKNLEEVLRRLPSPEQDDRFEPEYLRFSAEYRRIVINKLNRMELLGASVSAATRNYPLTASYISLRVLSSDSDGRRRGSPDGPDALQGQRVEDALADRHRILIIGDAGSGKTTLLRYLAVMAAQREFPETLLTWNGAMPFLISLRQYVREDTSAVEFPAPKDFPKAIAVGADEGMPSDWVAKHLSEGQAVVLVDGLDEVPEGSIRARAIEWLDDIILHYPKARYVVTSRPAAVDHWTDNRFTLAELQPMSTQDVRIFIHNWHIAMYREMGDNEQRKSLHDNERALNFAIGNDRSLRQLAVNPLLCALLCALNRDRSGILPKARMEIYSAALEMLLDRRDRERGLSDLLDYSAQLVILKDLGFWLLRQGLVSAPVDRIEKRIERSLASIPSVRMGATDVLKYLLTRSGLLRSPSVGHVDFVHKTFQEYLAAQAAVEDDEIEMLIAHASNDQWREVIVMAAGHAQRRQREDLFSGLLEACSTSDLDSRTRVTLLTVACLQTAAQLDIEMRRKVELVAKDLLPPKTMDEAASLAPVGDMALETLASYPPTSISEAAASIRLASLVGGEQALKFIAEVAEKIDGLQYEVLRAMSAFDPAVYAQQVLGRARFDSELTVTDESVLRYVGVIGSLERLRFETSSLADLSGLGAKPSRLKFVSLSVPARSSFQGIERWKGLTHIEVEIEHLLPDLSVFGLLESLEDLRITVRHGISLNVNLLPLRNLRSLQYLELIVDSYTRIDPSQLSGRKGLTIAGSRTVDFVGRSVPGINTVHVDKTSTKEMGLLPRENPMGTF